MKRSEITLIWLFFAVLLSVVNVFCQAGDDIENESRSSLHGAKPLQDQDDSAETETESGMKGSIITELQRYKHLFSQHRASQLEAVKSILSFGDNTRRYELVNMMLKQLFKTLGGAQQNLTSFGFLPGDPFPENETIREGVSKVLENTALFGDIVLRLPDIVHDFYDRQKEWQLLLAWSYGFCIQSQVFDGPNEKLLNLMAQEVNLIPADPNYVNPFKANNQPKEKRQEKERKIEKKKAKKKLKRGPRMSHTEL